MSIKLLKVELSNIRSHKHIVFEPENGVTAISGPNGRGKSTIVDSIAWALYGTKPQGLSRITSIMREDAVFGKEKFYARVSLEVDNTTLLIERRITTKQGAIECEVFEKVDNTGVFKTDYQNVAGPAVSHAEKEIKKRLQMDEQGFLSAILVQQKQVDQLISATPKERAKVIEKLTGISSITTALTEARQEYNTIKKAVSFTNIDESQLGVLKKENKKIDSELTNNRKKLATINESLKKLKEDGVKVRKELKEMKNTFEKRNKLTNENQLLENNIKNNENTLKELLETKNSLKQKLGLLDSSLNIDEIRKTYKKLQDELFSKNELIKRLETENNKLQEDVDKSNKFVGRSKVKDVNVAKSHFAKKEEKLEEITLETNKIKESIVSHKSTINQILNAINVLSDSHNSCPTCLQKVENADAAILALKEQVEENNAFISKSELRIVELEKTYEKEKDTQDKLLQLIEALNTINDNAVLIKENEDTINLSIAERKITEAEYRKIEKVLNDLKYSVDVKKEYDTVLKKAQVLSENINSDKTLLINNNDLLKGLKVISKDRIDKTESELEVLTDKYTDSFGKQAEIRGNVELLEEKLTNVTKDISKLEKDISNYKEMLNSVETISNTISVIEEFRANRIENSIPVLEAYASDLLNRFTEGVFTGLKIDSKFNTTVVLANGAERPVGILSGGELSAASMALRLAISLLLNTGSNNNLIILDEVLVSQDSGRVETILSTIKEVSKGQVILIAHNDIIDSIADKVVEL